MVDRQPLLIEEGKLALGLPQPSPATRLLEGRGFVTTLQPGDMVSLHWGWICERISLDQVRSLERYTAQHLAIANQTL